MSVVAEKQLAIRITLEVPVGIIYELKHDVEHVHVDLHGDVYVDGYLILKKNMEPTAGWTYYDASFTSICKKLPVEIKEGKKVKTDLKRGMKILSYGIHKGTNEDD